MPFTDKDREKLTEMHTVVTQKLSPMADDHEGRIRGLEKSRNYERGVIGAIGAFMTYIGTHIIK